MASRKRSKLPPLKVIHHSQKEATEVYRGHVDADMEILGREQTQCLSVHEPSNAVEELSVNEISELYSAEDTDPILHELHRKATADVWEKLR